MDKHKGKADNLPWLSPCIWTKYYKNLHSIKSQAARNKNEKLVDAKDRAEDDEVRALGAVCVWDSTSEAIDFSLNKCLYHLSARTCEAAGQLKQNLTYKELQEDTHKFDVLKLELDRHKVDVTQHPVVFPHREGIFQDFYFGLASQFLLVKNDSPYIFPSFAEKVRTKQAGDAITLKLAVFGPHCTRKYLDA